MFVAMGEGRKHFTGWPGMACPGPSARRRSNKRRGAETSVQGCTSSGFRKQVRRHTRALKLADFRKRSTTVSGKTVNSAILLLVIGNAMAILSDVFIKLLHPGAPVFQFAFLRCVLTLVFLLPLARKLDRSNLFGGLKIHAIRAHIHLVGIVCLVVALTALPLATANALFYAAPILVMVLSAGFFSEKLTPLSVTAVFSGFAGIIVILRPVDFNWAVIAALGSAFALAINAVMVRQLPKEQTTVHKLFLNYL